jgi:hypothetical protein
MAKNKLSDLRDHLFLTLEKLHDGDIEVKTAKAICDVSKEIIESAKVEYTMLRDLGGHNTGFFQELSMPRQIGEYNTGNDTKPKDRS